VTTGEYGRRVRGVGVLVDDEARTAVLAQLTAAIHGSERCARFDRLQRLNVVMKQIVRSGLVRVPFTT